MPEVKWVAPTELHDHDGKYLTRPPVVRIPILTLDQIEEWLRREWEMNAADAESLLALVQAWKEGK